ncbi:MAG TPA: metallophosphoesterase [Nitrososphaeraceae archaeon]
MRRTSAISKRCIKLSSCMLFSIVSLIIFSIFFTTTNSFASHNQIDDKGFNIITTADVGCSWRAQENIKNIEKLDPELFLVAGDLSYENTPDCWLDMTKSLDSKTKIAIGNHDDYEDEGSKGEKLKKLYMDHYGLNKSYYSFDYQNVHVLVLDTQLELSVDTLESTAIINETTTTTTTTSTKDTTKIDLEEDKKVNKDKDDLKNKIEKEPLLELFPLVDLENFLKQNSIDIEIPELEELEESNAKVPALDINEEQYQFVLDDLEKTSHNKDIDWIFVMFHKPMYSSLSKQFEEYIIRDKYHDIFDKYGVDLVIQGHNHLYSRTLPLSFNKLDISQPIIDQSSTNNNNVFIQPQGTIFLVVGVGGEELHRIADESYYISNEYNQGFGFVDLKIDGKRLDGKFYDINLNCKLEDPKKKGKPSIDLDSCLPPLPSPTLGNDNLKVIDQFSIIKENSKN